MTVHNAGSDTVREPRFPYQPSTTRASGESTSSGGVRPQPSPNVKLDFTKLNGKKG